ncbi:MAG: phosphonate ABC transporter, permease protein PhnE [Burkholderiales bacterium]
MADARPPLPPKPVNLFPVWAAACLGVLWAISNHLELTWEAVLYGMEDMREYVGRYGAPDFSEGARYVRLMGQTVATAFWGTMLSIVIAFAIAPLASRPLSPNRFTYRVARECLNVTRAIPDMLLALVFVAALGLGPLAGVLAVGLHTGGFMGKFCAESMERVEPGVYEALAATGASLPQRALFAAWPSILREAVGYALFIFDRNVRMASVLGLVGAGGIGLALHDTLRLFDYGRSAALIVVMLATILIIDLSSTAIRGRLR